jgi:predicted transcriptional regulator
MSDSDNNNIKNNSNRLTSGQYLVPGSGGIQRDIYYYICKNPGIRYRELIRLSGITNGVLSYHLGKLEKTGEIRVERQSNNRVSRYFIANIPKEDSDVIGWFRSKVTRSIVFFVLKNEFCTFNEIVDQVGKAPSTISWHVKRLREAGILSTNNGNDRLLYNIIDKVMINRILVEYKETFTDRIIENYTDIIDRL